MMFTGLISHCRMCLVPQKYKKNSIHTQKAYKKDTKIFVKNVSD